MSAVFPRLTRRSFAFGISAAVGGIILGDAPGFAAALEPNALSAADDPEITVWVVIERDDTVIIRVARSEMGQGSFTALPMLVAEELECDWARVKPEYVAPAANLARGRAWGDMVTAGSLSIRSSQSYLRKAGAQARTMLVTEAAARWDVAPATCTARDSIVAHPASGRTVRYGEIAEAASRRVVPQDVALKDPKDWRLLGRSVSRVDTLDKVLGRPIYASDVRLPDMLHAAIAACPSHGGRLVGFDQAKVAAMPGVRHVVTVGDDAVAVVATSWWQAKKALEALPVTWDEMPGAGLSSAAIRESFIQGLDAEDVAIGRKTGDFAAAAAGAASIVSADYQVPYLAHATMEPQTCTAHVTADGAEVWAPTQNGEGTLRVVAKVLGIDPSKVIIHKRHLGGGFGRRGLAQDWARQAVLIAKQVGQPVKMIWTREEDVRHDYYRPACVARHTAAFDDKGKFIAWKTRLCGSSISAQLATDRLKNGQDIEMMGGFLAADMVYGVPNLDVGYVMRNTAVPVGFWRGVNHSQNGFFREAFIDELAHARGKDPYLFRRELLAGSPRSLAVLDEVARRADWGKTSGGIHQGIAIVECYDSVCAHVVELSVDRSGAVQVHRVLCAVDCGYVVNPGIVKAQMEGAIAFGLIAALSGEITLQAGRVDQSNFHDYPVLRIHEMPQVETYLVPSGNTYSEKWGGIGEPGLPPLAPALTSAVFAATGKRIRSLPLKNHDLAPA
jgi:isoquinoline 1-oxidoreductase subunit beta